MQLKPRVNAWLAVWLVTFVRAVAHADGSVDATTTAFYERGGPLHMLVVNPSANARGDIADRVSVRAGWEADVVTGASVAVVDAPSSRGMDAITTATVVKDFRQVIKGGAGLHSEDARLDVQYAYGFEHDYRSHALQAAASTDLPGRNTQFSLRYGRGWDAVCDLKQPVADTAVERRRMPDATGCFEKSSERMSRKLALHGLDAAWTQAWTPIFNTQLSLSTQLLSGFQSNPYRAVWLGRAAVQEHHPHERARHAISLASRIWLRPLATALQLEARAYRDSWDVVAFSGEAALERSFGELVRLRVRGRYYRQGAAAFFSDDYALNPRGQYFTGDRELSGLHNMLVGAQLQALIRPANAERVLGMFEQLRIVLKADYLQHSFTSFHYGSNPIPNRRSVFGTLGLDAAF
jgi:hypothetical protein